MDDSKYIAAAIYVTSIVLAVTTVSTYTLMDYVNVYPAVVGMGFLLGTTMILGLVFVPRVSRYTYLRGGSRICLREGSKVAHAKNYGTHHKKVCSSQEFKGLCIHHAKTWEHLGNEHLCPRLYTSLKCFYPRCIHAWTQVLFISQAFRTSLGTTNFFSMMSLAKRCEHYEIASFPCLSLLACFTYNEQWRLIAECEYCVALASVPRPVARN